MVTVVSGGQTGVDRAALDVARELGLSVDGWCPAGRRAEDGPLDARYPLRETPSADPAQRTEWNVRDADATLLLLRSPAFGGTALALGWAERLGKPHLVCDPAAGDVEEIRRWLWSAAPGRLNVAGPRESESPGIYLLARAFLERLLGQTFPSG